MFEKISSFYGKLSCNVFCKTLFSIRFFVLKTTLKRFIIFLILLCFSERFILILLCSPERFNEISLILIGVDLQIDDTIIEGLKNHNFADTEIKPVYVDILLTKCLFC